MASRFSKRTSWDTGEDTLARLIRERRASGLELLDLTISNPTICGFDYGGQTTLSPLANPDALTYDPDPRGIQSAREAVVRYYASHDAVISPGQIVLTTSSSEAYSFLFRLLCDPGDAILAAQPSYPLFDFLATLDDVSLVTYPLFEDFGWWIDFAELERKIGPRTRAVIVVHPNNPTGHATSRAEREELEAICVRHDLALIVDEVFLDYGLSGPVPSFASGTHPCPTFVVSGLSKIAALPQMKVGWIACLGPDGVRRDALSRLEVIADTFLSMNAPAQYALPFWLEGREEIQRQVLARVRTNLTTLAGSGLNFLPVEAGWSAIIRLPQNRGGSHVADRLVTEVGVAVHPGTFYGLPGSRSVVVSLIGGPEVFSRGIQNLKEWCEPGKLT